MDYFSELIEFILDKRPAKQVLANKKIQLCKKHKQRRIPTDIEVLLRCTKEDMPKVRKYLQTKPGRSLSGVSVVAVMTKPHKCPHGKCSICPGGIGSEYGDVPQSYTGMEPATRRAKRNSYDPYLQVFNRLEQYIASGHEPEKIELIVMGGTFISTPKAYRDRFVMLCFKAMNDFSYLFYRKGVLDIERYRKFFEMPGDIRDENRERRIKAMVRELMGTGKLEAEQIKNEKSHIRCVGLTIETRPDYGLREHGDEMLRLGCTRVEIGIQSVYDEALRFIERGHTIDDNIRSIRELRDLGFKLNFHYMPGLVSRKKDLAGLKMLFDDPDYRPDMLKIYPCMVMPGTGLYDSWKKGLFKPLTTTQAAGLIADFKRYVPEYCRIMRVQRDIPTYMTTAGVDRTNLRQYIMKHMEANGIKCRCIRCREVGDKEIKGSIDLSIYTYSASEGMEFFLSADADDKILGFCRMRFPAAQLRKEITRKSALIRELHVYGAATGLGKQGAVQHRGLGKKLLVLAEKTAKKSGRDKIVVISGIGVRGYYRKLGYRKQGPYMVKSI